MVDYSKWNNFHDSDEDEEDDSGTMSNKPLVHQFDQPTTITIGPNGPNYQPTTTNSSSHLSSNPLPTASPSSSSSNTSTLSGASPPLGEVHKRPLIPRNENLTHSWEQTRYDVTIWIPVPLSTSFSEIKLEFQNKKQLIILINSVVYFEKEFKYEIKLDQDEIIDWELIHEENQKCIKLIVTKHQYLPESIMWWNTCFLGDNEIDVMNIPQRKMTSKEKMRNKISHNFGKNQMNYFKRRFKVKSMRMIMIGRLRLGKM